MNKIVSIIMFTVRVHMPSDTQCALQPSEADVEKARAEAAKSLTNIDGPERQRRITFGGVLTVSSLRLQAQPTEHCLVSAPASAVQGQIGKPQQLSYVLPETCV